MIKINEKKHYSNRISLKTLFELSNSLCKIILIKTETEREIRGTGFFMKIEGNKDFYCLITTYHIITEELITLNKSIEIITEGGYNQIINFDNKDRRIIKFCKDLDITVIEILDKDIIKNKVNYLSCDINDNDEYNKYLGKDFFILQYPKGKYLEFSNGRIINKINEYKFEHSASTYKGSSGSPIILFKNKKVIGVHIEYLKENNNIHNIGAFIGIIYKELINLKNSRNLVLHVIDKGNYLLEGPGQFTFTQFSMKGKQRLSLCNITFILGDCLNKFNIE